MTPRAATNMSSAAAHLTQDHQTAGKLHNADVCRSDVWVGGQKLQKRKRRKKKEKELRWRLTVTHEVVGAVFVCFVVCAKNKKQDKKLQDKDLMQQQWFRSSWCVVLFVVFCLFPTRLRRQRVTRRTSLCVLACHSTRPSPPCFLVSLSCHNYTASLHIMWWWWVRDVIQDTAGCVGLKAQGSEEKMFLITWSLAGRIRLDFKWGANFSTMKTTNKKTHLCVCVCE